MLAPNFFIIGAAKAATSSLSSLLEMHPEAAIARTKEPHFFSQNNRYAWGWNAYMSLFSHCHTQKAVGDASTSYSRIRVFPEVIDRIKLHVPQAKIIYMVRHPLKRVESAYVELVSTKRTAWYDSVNAAVRALPTFVHSCLYWEIFDAYRQRFGESRIKVIWFEEYIANQAAVFQDVCRFLEIDDTRVPDLESQYINSREAALGRLTDIGGDAKKVDTKWDEETRRAVIDEIRADNLRFLAYFGRSKEHWGDLF